MKFFDFAFSAPQTSMSEAMHVTCVRIRYQTVTKSLVSHFVFLSESPNGYRLFQVFCHKKSFVFFSTIEIFIEAWIID